MKKFVKGIVAVILALGTCLAVTGCSGKSMSLEYVNPDSGSTYSIITKLDLKVEFNGDTVSAKVKNTFTFFPATARVNVYLYCSETYSKDYTSMTEVASNYTGDLDQGKTLEASYDTKGRGGYYLARMLYKIDSRAWEERCTEVYYRDYTKAVLEAIEDDGSFPVIEDVEPVYGYNFDDTEEVFHVNTLKYPFEAADFVPYNCYKKFAALYNENFQTPLDKEFFVFNFQSGEYSKCLIRNFSLLPTPNVLSLRLDKESRYILTTGIRLYIDEYGINPASKQSGLFLGVDSCNLALLLYSGNIDYASLKGEFSIKFGQKSNDYFINLYIGDFCFGTCYITFYNVAKDIPYAIFYNMFVEQLISSSHIM